MMHRPKKRLGQNFLQDAWVIDAILEAFHPEASSNVVEIGPGLGALTKPLLLVLNALTAIEMDEDLAPPLKSLPMADSKLNLILADALTVDYGQFGDNLRLIGNLPYNISTPLIFHLLRFSPHILDMHWMLQKEVVDRIAAQPGCKAYGRLSVAVQYHCDVEALFCVPSSAFFPSPKVDSAIVRLTPHRGYSKHGFIDLERLLAKAFSMRRKTLTNNLKGLLTPNDWGVLGIDPSQRPEQISVTDYVHIAKFLAK